MEIQMLNQNGSKDSTIDLPEKVFSEPYNSDLVHQLISTYIFNGHQNTKGQKNRSAVRGGGRKPWKQKGTGRARAGTIRSPIWRGGGVTFAHEYKEIKKKKINKKMYRLAMRSIWSKLALEKKILAIKGIEVKSPPKVSELKKILSSIGVSKGIFIIPKENLPLTFASKNLPDINVKTVHSIDPAELFNANKVVITPETVDCLKETLL